MDTILTDDERTAIIQAADGNTEAMSSSEMRLVELTESAVLAKLARQEPARAMHLGWDTLDNGTIVATYALPVKNRVAPKIYAHPAPQQDDRQRVPEGWKLVPAEPTPEMMVAAQEADMDHGDHDEWLEYDGEDVKRIHRAMLAAAPEAPAQAEQVPKAWMHEEDPYRVISDVQKQQAIRDGGASASSVRPYSIALVAPEAPAQASAVDERAAPEVTEFNVGRWCLSEDDCIEQGIDFAAYERGVDDAAAFGQARAMDERADCIHRLAAISKRIELDIEKRGRPSDAVVLRTVRGCMSALAEPQTRND